VHSSESTTYLPIPAARQDAWTLLGDFLEYQFWGPFLPEKLVSSQCTCCGYSLAVTKSFVNSNASSQRETKFIHAGLAKERSREPQQTIDEIVLVKPFGFWTNCGCSLAEPPTLSSRSPIRATARHTLVATGRRCAEMIDRHCSESQLLLRHAKARHAVVLTKRARSFEHAGAASL